MAERAGKKLRRVYAQVLVYGLGASVEAREHGGADRPVVLCDEGGRQVVSVSPEARRRGIRPGMSRWEAERLCPGVVAAEKDPEKYEHFWRRVVEICGDYSPEVREMREADMGVPALQLDLTGTDRLFGPAKRIGQEIRNRLRAEMGLWASVGIGPSRLAARLACESARPGWVVEVGPKEMARFVARLPIAALPGVDYDWARRLSEMGIRRAKDRAAGRGGGAGLREVGEGGVGDGPGR